MKALSLLPTYENLNFILRRWFDCLPKSINKMNYNFPVRRLFHLFKSALVNKRCKSSIHQENIRVRFAPSPTGYIHLGGLRTALYNHIFAKSKKGSTIIRIEDTDRSRTVKDASERIIKDLEWCGINFDEGPYFQSERKEIYEEHARLLVQNNHAYHCFCSQTRLDLLRKELLKSGEVVKYDNKCRNLSKEEVESKLRKNETHCIRFKLSDDITEFEDMIYGHYHHNLSEQEGDPVILKTDGYPTYHLANVVDDHHMQISHVLRGSEWLVSTIKHLLMFKAFKWQAPKYGHLPLLLNSNGTKISKRQNDLQIRSLKDSGIFPNTLVNIVTRAGGGFEIDHWERDERNFTLEELIDKFDMSKIHRNSCKLPMERLLDCNRLEMKRMMENEEEKNILIGTIRDTIQGHFSSSNVKAKLNLSEKYISRVLKLSLNRIYKADDLLSPEFRFMWVIPEYKFVESKSLKKEDMEELAKQIDQLDEGQWDRESLSNFFKNFAEHRNISYRDLMGILRIILTSFKDGPGVGEILTLLGKENSLLRLKMSLGK